MGGHSMGVNEDWISPHKVGAASLACLRSVHVGTFKKNSTKNNADYMAFSRWFYSIATL